MQRILLRDTVDLDIENCIFSLLGQIVKRLDFVDPKTWTEELGLLQTLQSGRKELCQQRLGVNEAVG